MRTRGRLAIALVAGSLALAAFALVPQTNSTFYLALAFNVLIFALLAMSADLLGGYTGLFSLAHASLFGTAAYGVAIAQNHGHSPWQSVGLGLAAAVAVGAVAGTIAVRVDGLAFVMVTLAIGQILWGLAFRWTSFTGGENGQVVFARPGLAGHTPVDNGDFYWVVLAVVVLLMLVLRLIVASPFTLALEGIRDNEPRMRSLGYRTYLHKYAAFVLSSFFAGCAGVLFAFYNLFVSSSTMDFLHNGYVLVMVVFGGMGTLWGALIGAVFIVCTQQWLSLYFERWATAVGVVLILTILFAPGGILGIWNSLLARLRRDPGGEEHPPAAAIAVEQTGEGNL
jgi:branched-chain amino acid transport system permease protein